MKNKIFSIIGVIALVLVIIVSASGWYLFRGMEEIRKIEVGNIDLPKIEDGTYEGVFDEGFRWSNRISVSVYDHKIIGITIVESQTFEVQDVSEELFQRVINQQSIDVDVISGSTLSSKAYLKAIEEALK